MSQSARADELGKYIIIIIALSLSIYLSIYLSLLDWTDKIKLKKLENYHKSIYNTNINI